MTYINPSHVNLDTPTCIDLFSGAGGLSLGFCQAGGIPVAAVDHDLDATATYKKMFPFCREVYCGDIESWKPTPDLQNVDVIIGGPPCQGFSLARGLRFVDDPRNHLYKEFVRLVAEIRPLCIVMENVEGITNIGKGAILQQIYEDFEQIGYHLDHRVINMADYGVPQSRKRTIFVGFSNGTRFFWPEPTHQSIKNKQAHLFEARHSYVSVFQALGDLPWPMGNYFSHRANSQMRGPRNRNTISDPAFTLRIRGDEFALCQEEAQGAFVPGPLPEVQFTYRPVQNNFQHLMRELPPPWITDYVPPPVLEKPVEVLQGTRRLAVIEQARLQTFPDWFNFSGRPYAQGRQIGNAVPPLFARQLFAALIKQLNDIKVIEYPSRRMPELAFEKLRVARE